MCVPAFCVLVQGAGQRAGTEQRDRGETVLATHPAVLLLVLPTLAQQPRTVSYSQVC